MLPGPEWARSGARARTRACDEGRHERKTPTAGRAAAAPCAAAADTTPANANGSAPAAVPTSGMATSATLRAVVFAEDIHGTRLSLQCTMKPSTLLAKLMRGWSQHYNQPLDGVAFLHGGAVLRPEHTPADLGWSAAREPLEILAVPRENVEGAPPLAWLARTAQDPASCKDARLTVPEQQRQDRADGPSKDHPRLHLTH